MKKILIAILLLMSNVIILQAQKLTVDKVYKSYMRNSGTIMENNQTKGYFFLYQSDKIDRNTNEYTLQILDQNLNKVKDIKFEDSKKLSLLESSYNGSTIGFLFKNEDSKTLDFKVYDLSGKLKYVYTRDYDRRTEDLMKRYEMMQTDESTNQNVFDMGEDGYATVLPLRDGKLRTYEVDYFSSGQKKQWAYVPDDDEEKYASAEFLGNSDSLIFLQVMKKNRAMSSDVSAHLVGINFITKKKQFDLNFDNDKFKFVATNLLPIKGTNKFMVMGSYFNPDDNVIKDFSKGLAVYVMDTKGTSITKTYNSWAEDFAKFLPVNSKGKLENIGYLFIHNMLQTPEGKMYVVSEGYKRQANAAGIAFNVLMAAGGGVGTTGNTKMVVTDMVIMELNDKFKLTKATVYDKTDNTASTLGDLISQHAMAVYMDAMGAFDYAFTTGEPDNSNFSICYNDYEKSSDFKGKTFNSIHFNGSKFTTDKIELKSKATIMKIFPAKAGSIMIMEYFKKDKKLDFRLEKLG